MKSILLLLLVVSITAIDLSAQVLSQPKVGDPAPDFSLPYATKDSIGQEDLKLSAIIGQRSIVLAFYPADWSGGCTKEMCTMRDNFAELAKLGADIIGISGDYEYAHHVWAKELALPITLAADHRHFVARAYGSYNEMTGYNRRTIFVIDKKGLIAYTDLAYSVRDMNSFNKLRDALTKLH